MNEYRKKLRRDLGYEDDDNNTTQELKPTKVTIPGRYFAYTAVAIFLGGIIGLVTQIDSKEIGLLSLFFSMSFLLAPAILIFPVFRMLLGEEKNDLSAFLSALFGYYIQSKIKNKIDKQIT